MLINTGRGALIDTRALIKYLKSGHIGSAGLDVYEEEEGLFFEDLSEQILQDDKLARLLTFPNVLMTSHQAFLTEEALENIAQVTLQNISEFEHANDLKNEVCAETHIVK
jgi:D-lactate dehydrogenase